MRPCIFRYAGKEIDRRLTVKINPALPHPYTPSSGTERSSVAGVSAPHQARDANDEPDPKRHPMQALDVNLRTRLEAMNTGRDSHREESLRSQRALASYAAVADDSERSGLRDLLGFDAYA